MLQSGKDIADIFYRKKTTCGVNDFARNIAQTPQCFMKNFWSFYLQPKATAVVSSWCYKELCIQFDFTLIVAWFDVQSSFLQSIEILKKKG